MSSKKALFSLFGALLLACFTLLGGVYGVDSCSTDAGLYLDYLDFNSGSPPDHWNATFGSIDQLNYLNSGSIVVYEGNASAKLASPAPQQMTKFTHWVNKTGVSIEYFANYTCVGAGTAAFQLRNIATNKISVGVDCATSTTKILCNAVDSGANIGTGFHDYRIYNNGSNYLVYQDGVKICTTDYLENDGNRIYLGTSDNNGYIIIDKLMIYNGETCPTSDSTPPTNSSWNVTSTASLYNGENSSVWNIGGTINISADLLSFTVTASESSNMSCRLDVEQNYTQMVAANSAYKATTTETTAHSYTLYDSITRGTHCVYCSFIDALGNEPAGSKSSSGCLNINMNRTINITNILPTNNSNLTDFTVDFFFNVTDNASCNLTANNSVIGTVAAIAGTNNVSYTLTNNGNYEWFLMCGGNRGATWLFRMGSTIPEGSDELGIGECDSSSTGYVLLMFLLISVSFAFLIIGLMFGWGLLGFISGFLFMISSWYIAGCVPIFAFIMALIGIIIVIYFALKGVF